MKNAHRYNWFVNAFELSSAEAERSADEAEAVAAAEMARRFPGAVLRRLRLPNLGSGPRGYILARPKPSHARDAIMLLEAAAQELALVPKARKIERAGGPPFDASLHLHIAIDYVQGARRAIARSEKEVRA